MTVFWGQERWVQYVPEQTERVKLMKTYPSYIYFY